MPVSNNMSFYRGQSMEGTFRLGDCLVIKPVRLEDIHPGDVVVYRGVNHHGNEDKMAHRVMRRTSNGLEVRGDNSRCMDIILVTEDNFLGRVSHVKRGKKRYCVRRKKIALIRARIRHGILAIKHIAWMLCCVVGKNPYGRLRKSNLVSRVWHPSIRKIRLNTLSGPLIKYLYRGRTVASYWPEKKKFECMKPFDLVCRRKP